MLLLFYRNFYVARYSYLRVQYCNECCCCSLYVARGYVLLSRQMRFGGIQRRHGVQSGVHLALRSALTRGGRDRQVG